MAAILSRPQWVNYCWPWLLVLKYISSCYLILSTAKIVSKTQRIMVNSSAYFSRQIYSLGHDILASKKSWELFPLNIRLVTCWCMFDKNCDTHYKKTYFDKGSICVCARSMRDDVTLKFSQISTWQNIFTSRYLWEKNQGRMLNIIFSIIEIQNGILWWPIFPISQLQWPTISWNCGMTQTLYDTISIVQSGEIDMHNAAYQPPTLETSSHGNVFRIPGHLTRGFP